MALVLVGFGYSPAGRLTLANCIGTSPAVTGTPEEEVGYLASDEYTHRMASPDPDSHGVSHASVESPLRNMSIPASEIEKTQETTNEKETPHETSREEPGVIHVDDPYHSLYHPDGFAPAPPTEKQSHGQGDDNVDDEPILAADEVRPESASLHPAVSPTFDVKESAEHGARSQTPSSARSRPASHHGSVPAPAKYSSCEDIEKHTQLEDVEEYEPLFPEDDNQEKPIAAAERFKKRPDMLKHRFPSEDVWEDSPNSLQLQATVTTPELPKEDLFETPEQEAARKSQTEHVDPHEVASHILESEDHDQKTPERPQIAKQRFPSRDVWEDAPDSQQLVTTIEPPKDDIKSPAAAKSPDVPPKPNIPPRPQRQPQAAPPVDTSSKPTISPTEKKAPPVIPGRPKPQIPARPAKPASMGSSENLTRVTSGGSTSGGEENKPSLAPPTKEKPAVPSRPGGSRIAALKAGFLSDLNSRLQVGPQGPKPQENKEEQPPAEKAPLSDARKGRARGPARRKPANGNKPTQEPVAPKVSAAPEVRITEAWSVWQFDADGDLVVGGEEKAKPNIEPKEPELAAPDVSLSAESTMAPEIVKNTAGEPADPKPTFEREPTQPEIVEPIETTPKLEPTIPPAFAEVTDTSLALEEAPSPTASPMDENKVAPAAPFTLETTAEPTTGTVTESATETASKPDVEVLPEASASATKFDRAPSDTSEMDEAIEKMAPSTDRKKSSDSEVHSPQQSST